MKLALLILLAACGRVGFDERVPDDAAIDPDADAGIDADVARCGSPEEPLALPGHQVCAGATYFAVPAAPGQFITVGLQPANAAQLPHISVTLETADGSLVGNPVWNDTAVRAAGLVTREVVARVDSDTAQPVLIQADIPEPAGPVHYISPDGDDSGDGSLAHPWQTWPKTFERLQAGDTLIVRDGTWTDRRGCDGLPTPCFVVAPILTSDPFTADAELPDANCTTTAHTGAIDAPVTVVAEHQRRAFIAASGHNRAFSVNRCAYWIVDGLHAAGDDEEVSGDPGRVQKNVFEVVKSPNFLGRHLLGERANRCSNDWVFGIGDGSTNTRIEDSEAYSFHRNGFFAADALGVVFRRDYAHGRDYPDLPCTMPDIAPGPDVGMICYNYINGPICKVENSIVEHAFYGFFDDGSEGFDVTGSAALSTYEGVRIVPQSTIPPSSFLRRVTNVLVVDSAIGIETSAHNVAITGATVVNARVQVDSSGGTAVRDYITPNPSGGDYAGTTTATNVLTLGAESFDFHFDQPTSTVHYSSAASGAPAVPFVPIDGNIGDDAGSIQRSLTTKPTRIGDEAGKCLAYTPSDDVLAASGEGGAPLGAQLVHRVEQPLDLLWNQRTGAFFCGAIVPGVNDVAGASCRDVHLRLRIGTPGCPIPR